MCPAGQGQGSWDTKPTWRTESEVYTLICWFSRLGTGRWQPEAEEACCFLSISELCNDGTSHCHRPPECVMKLCPLWLWGLRWTSSPGRRAGPEAFLLSHS